MPGLRWPIDPALADGPDETTLVRALLATPLRTEPGTGALRFGLCRGWEQERGFRAWVLDCRRAPAIARTLRRVGRLAASPSAWLFARARVTAPDDRTLVVRLPFPWRRFPYALTAAAAAPRGVRGPFRIVAASPGRLVAARAGLRLVFLRMTPRAAVVAFRRGEVDVAPVPLGDIRAVAADRALAPALRVRPLAALDLVQFDLRHGSLARRPDTRRAYWDTADRGDYQALVAEYGASTALGLVGARRADPAAFRRALRRIPSLPLVRVRVAVPRAPLLRYGAGILLGQWRQAGLGPELVAPGARADARFRRVAAAYPQAEALPAALLLRGGPPAGRVRLERALAREDQSADLRAADDALQETAAVVPVAWAADARLVSPRLRGWRRDVLGDVDYTKVSTR